MKVTLMAHTQLSEEFRDSLNDLAHGVSDGQIVSVSAVRTCYSSNKPSEIPNVEGAKYFGTKATDGGAGTEADRLIRQIMHSKHVSTVEHLSFTFAVEGVSRSLLAQLTRHRAGFGYSVQSQRYVRLGSNDKSGGFDYVTPGKIGSQPIPGYSYAVDIDENYEATEWANYTAKEIFDEHMRSTQETYDRLRKAGVPPEDCRAVLPNAATTNLVLSVNLRALLDFYSKRKHGKGAQSEIADLAEVLKEKVIGVESWTKPFFEGGNK